MLCVLVVDDEVVICRVFCDIFEFEKYEVVEVINGIECLVKFK